MPGKKRDRPGRGGVKERNIGPTGIAEKKKGEAPNKCPGLAGTLYD